MATQSSVCALSVVLMNDRDRATRKVSFFPAIRESLSEALRKIDINASNFWWCIDGQMQNEGLRIEDLRGMKPPIVLEGRPKVGRTSGLMALSPDLLLEIFRHDIALTMTYVCRQASHLVLHSQLRLPLSLQITSMQHPREVCRGLQRMIERFEVGALTLNFVKLERVSDADSYRLELILASMKHLKWLDVSFNFEIERHWALIKAPPALRRLSMSKTSMTMSAFRHLGSAHWPGLLSVDMIGIRCIDSADMGLALEPILNNFGDLERLEMSRVCLTGAGPRLAAAFSKMPCLKELRLADTGLLESGLLYVLASLGMHCTQLQDLDASNCFDYGGRLITTEQQEERHADLMEMQLALRSLTSVTALNLSENKFLSCKLAIVASLASLPALTSLEMNECALGDDGMNTLGLSVLRLCPMQELTLRDNNVGNLCSLAPGSWHCTTLTLLDLRENRLQSENFRWAEKISHRLKLLV